ncbi:Gas vesicle protein G [Micromonospora viridifaciens]|uniref:Gas vesicle protein G n=1 Tax=Micromonospora viridifaciens TaxID=1881 RepID=A0A1C4UT00_MICVI|nr:gas vesicle protein GvpG [Micromonospora viridifaciens]SCE74823.1 Gas vesicle protein G [Micromonospora viridifaciens]
MDILWSLLTLPYAPVRGLTAVVKVIARQAESQQHDPVHVRRELEELDRAAAAGEITPEERERGEQQVLDRLIAPAAGRGPAAASGRDPAPAAGRDRRSSPVRRRSTARHRGRGR